MTRINPNIDISPVQFYSIVGIFVKINFVWVLPRSLF